jgi:hypothetical protein
MAHVEPNRFASKETIFFGPSMSKILCRRSLGTADFVLQRQKGDNNWWHAVFAASLGD